MTAFVRNVLARIFPLVIAARGLHRRIVRPIKIGVRALVIENDHILLVRGHGSRLWEMPGGGVKRGESLRAAAVREVREETGCPVEAERMLGVYLTQYEGMTNHIVVYVCRPTGTPKLALNFEIAEARYWPCDALPPLVNTTLCQRLQEYAAGATGVDGMW